MPPALDRFLTSPPGPLTLAVSVIGALLLVEVLFRVLSRWPRWWARRAGRSFAVHCWWPARFTAATAAASGWAPTAGMPPMLLSTTEHVLLLVLIASIAWLVVGLSFALEDVALARFPVGVKVNLRARRAQTQVMVLRRLTVVLVSLLAVAVMLLTFDSVRLVGTSLLASAGAAGLVIGIAGRPVLANLLAGIQILFAEPIRVDDVVVVQGEWGRIEEITFTYVVVRLWDERRMILPVSYFLEQPFENWTHSSASLLATVTIAVDFTVPVESMRKELQQVLEASPLWDRRVWNLQVTDLTHDHVELRALMSAPDAPTAWDLRCEVREKLLAYLQREHPESLATSRVMLVEAEEPSRQPAGRPDRADLLGDRPETPPVGRVRAVESGQRRRPSSR